MSTIQKLLTEHLDIWTAADTGPRSGRGRSSANAAKVYGISKLRELILELAVRGKLVPQDSNDEPASELLKRIQAEKSKLIAEGKVKKDKPLPPVTDADNQPSLPKGWEWTSLASIALVNPRNNAEDNLSASFVPMTMIGATFNSEHEQEPRTWKEIKQGFTHFAEGDIGVAKITPCFENSKACVFSGLLNGIGAGTTELHIVRPINGTLVPRYVLAYLKSPQFLMVGETKMTGTAGQKRLPKEFVESNPFPLPPLAEQHRIVAKVDELMALCDQLEAEHNNASEAHERLVSYLLGTLTKSQGAEDFRANWQRIAAHFDTLFTTEASIDALKQTLLQLAVMGKLVPQDPNDEPVSELLKRIQVEKTRLIGLGKLRKDQGGTKISDQEKPFLAPEGWSFVRFGDVSFNRDSERIPVSSDQRQSRKGKYDYYGASGVIDKVDNYLFDKPLLLIGEDGANLINRSTPIAFIARGKYWVNNHAHVIDGITECFLRYLELYINAVDLKPYVTGTAQPKMNQAKMNGIVVAIPPEAEQSRVIAKVDELMALCDHMKSRIVEARKLQRKLADVLVENAMVAKVRSQNCEDADSKTGQSTARTLLAAEVVHQLKAETRMGRVKLQKVVNLAEYIASLEEVASEPMRNVAGPHDPHFMEQVLRGMKDRQWYEEQPVDGGKSYRYRPLAQAGQHRAAYEALWSPEQRRKIHDLIELMRSWKTDQCERVATLYAAWNDLLIEGREVTDAAILHEVMNRWNDSKLNYTESQWQKELAAMKKHALLIPTGFGRRTTGGTQTLPFH